MSNTIVEAVIASKTITAGEFNGSFKLFAANWFRDLKFYGFSPEVSHKVCTDGMSQLGLAMSQDAALDAKVKKANKNGESGFKVSGSSGLVRMHNSMAVIRLVQMIDALRMEGLLHPKEFIRVTDMQTHLNPVLKKYITECEEWVKTATWEE
jgi:hypothetical protein